MIKKIFKVPITNYPPKIRDFRGLNPRNFSEIPEGQLLTTNKGLTLLEMAISMAILAIALVALANLFPIGLKLSRRASTFSEASILAQRVLENIKTAASVYDGDYAGYIGDHGDFTTGIPTDVRNGNGIGYFELASQDTCPFVDSDATITIGTTIQYKYNNTDMDVYIKAEDWDANGNGKTWPLDGDWDDVLLSQKVYVAVYWTEADRDRAETFITYIANPFYEKYR